MSTLPIEIDNFVQTQINKGLSAQKTRETIIHYLIQQDIDEKIAEGRADVKSGKIEQLTETWMNNFIEKATQRLSYKQS